ncbi:MAG: hypothetical protein LBD69_00440 [Puniceicoccales bacterium]|jgi:hypothetical protein|nr:hypothetical protein [Puniceicoccales bacterium]
MSPVNLNQVAGTPPLGAGAPTQPTVGQTATGRTIRPNAPPRPLPPQTVPGFVDRQGVQARRTVTLAKAKPLLAHLAGDKQVQVQAQEVMKTHVARAASYPQAFKLDGTFGGFVNGFVTGRTPEDKMVQVNDAYRAYRDCGLADASAREIKAGIQVFAGKINLTSQDKARYNELVAAGNFTEAFNIYLNAALGAYPGLFTSEEQDALKAEIVKRSVDLIKQITPPITPQDAANLIKENLDKILYQQFRDQSMITGSDHGIHHIVMGNIKNSLAILDGCPVTPREKLMVLQTMVDHDLGYTTYAAQADFGAAKDHPLASRAYVVHNMNPIFTPDEATFIWDSILSHSYPSDLDQPLDFTNNRAQSLRNVVAVVDAMGTTQDTKLPSVFRQPQIQAQLFEVGIEKLRYDPERRELQALEERGASASPQEVARRTQLQNMFRDQINPQLSKMEGKCKQAILQAINNIPDKDMPRELKARYRQAIEVDFSAQGAGMVVPQFAGSLVSAHAVLVPGTGTHKMAITMEVSLPEKLVQAITGQVDIAVQDRLNAFNKMATDIAPNRNLGEEIDRNLYGREAVRGRTTCTVETSLVNFTFKMSDPDVQLLDAWFKQDIDTYPFLT